MTEKIISELRACAPNFKNLIISSITLEKKSLVRVRLVTDISFTAADKVQAEKILKKYVPDYFGLEVEISKLAPDEEMIKKKIYSAIEAYNKAVFATLDESDISVKKLDGAFEYTIKVLKEIAPVDLCDRLNKYLKSNFCGEFYGKIIDSSIDIESIEVEEYHDEPEFEMPVRTFKIEDFSFLEGEKLLSHATYLSDLNIAKDEVIVCGTIEDIRERSYVNQKKAEKKYYIFTLNDNTAVAQITYFPRLKTIEKIQNLQVGDSIVCTGLNEEFKGNLRYTAKLIDFGKIPEGFKPEKRQSKPVPRYYKTVKPVQYTDMQQTDLFANTAVPECLKKQTFVVFDLETTGLNSSPITGNMDKIIEIGAFKIENGVICECFSTFINPQRKLSDEIINLTGITEDMVKDAPTYEKVMPDFFKFCQGSVLVGHNIVGFDYKFVDYYCANLGYILERKLIDTIPLSQELLFLSNYKLNTVAEKFNITFNHHRATDDALTTAKIFIELIKLKKSLPKFQ